MSSTSYGSTPRETTRAKQAWADYLALGPDRSVEKLLERYRSGPSSVPTRRRNTLKVWSTQYGWQDRLHAIASTTAKEAEEREAAYRRTILEEGYALGHERVKALKDLAGTLYRELLVEGRLWVSEPKQVGGTTVDVERFNAAQVEQFRGVLDDIAKEKGERKTVSEVTGKDGGDIIISTLADTERIRRYAALLERARARTRQADVGSVVTLAAPSGPPNGSVAE